MPIEDEIRYPNTGDYKAERELTRAYFAEKQAAEERGLGPAMVGTSLQTDDAARHILLGGPLAVDHGGSFWRYDGGVWRGDGDREVGRRIHALLVNQYRSGHATNIRDALEHMVKRIECEPVENVINFTNGLLEWSSGDLYKHDPDSMSTVQLSVPYRPNAACPAFDAYVAAVMHPDAHDLFWEIFGYLLLSGNPWQRAFLLLGTGANGKGVFIRTLERIVGRANASHVSLSALEHNSFAGAELFGKLVNVVGDIDAKFQETTAQFKSITGQDEIRAEKKYREPFSFRPWCVCVFSANAIPLSIDASHGYQRRWEVLEFPNTFDPEALPDLEAGFELDGVAAKAAHALRKLFEAGKFSRPDSAKKTRSDFVDTIDVVGRFVREECEPTDDPHQESSRAHVYERYRHWCESEGHRPLAASRFTSQVEAHGYRRIERNATPRRRFRGLRVLHLVVGGEPF